MTRTSDRPERMALRSTSLSTRLFHLHEHRSHSFYETELTSFNTVDIYVSHANGVTPCCPLALRASLCSLSPSDEAAVLVDGRRSRCDRGVLGHVGCVKGRRSSWVLRVD